MCEAMEYLYKVLVIGDVYVGKTSLIQRYVQGTFIEHYQNTLGADFALKTLYSNNNSRIKLQLWDIAGNERARNIPRCYYKGAYGAFVVFDVTNGTSFQNTLKWKKELDEKVILPNEEHIPVVLLGNKCDLHKESLSKHAHQLDQYCEANGFSNWFDVSAKTNTNIDNAAEYLTDKMMACDIVKPVRTDPIEMEVEQENAECCYNA